MIIIAVGIPGNILTIIVMRKKKFRAQNLSILFIALSLSDTFWLLFLPLKDIYEILTGTNIQNLTVISCKLVTTIIWIFSMMSNWILVAITLERALCILIPHRYKDLCNRTREKILLLLIIAIVFCLCRPRVGHFRLAKIWTAGSLHWIGRIRLVLYKPERPVASCIDVICPFYFYIHM